MKTDDRATTKRTGTNVVQNFQNTICGKLFNVTVGLFLLEHCATKDLSRCLELTTAVQLSNKCHAQRGGDGRAGPQPTLLVVPNVTGEMHKDTINQSIRKIFNVSRITNVIARSTET